MSGFEDEIEAMPDPASTPISIASALAFEDFCAYAPTRTCIYLPCRTPWPNASIDTRLPRRPLLDATGNPVLNSKGKVVTIPASTWLEQNRSVETLTWAPGEPELIRDQLAVDGGWVPKPGATTLNIYRPPTLELGDAARAERWVKHWHALYPADADHIIAWLASRVQRPEIKINHALVIGGAPKIGKDTLLEPIVTAVGQWNFRDITLTGLISKNNEFLRAVVVRLSEARDMGEQGRVDRYGLYDHTKNMLVTPPYTLRVNEKYVREYYIFNCFGMVITTNHRDALYLPPDDRRHFVAFSECRTEQFDKMYWNDFWNWYNNKDGIKHVVAYLHQYDLSRFDPKAPPPTTPAFWYMVGADRGEAHGELLDAVAMLGSPKALTISQLVEKAPGLEWLQDLKMRRMVRKRLEDSGYLFTLNADAASDGLWTIKKKRQAIYARSELSLRQREDAAHALWTRLNAGQ
jgi:uncharacterized protein DUF5906